MKEKKVYFVSLGCSKNLVDSEVMLGSLKKHNFQITNGPEDASVIIINTCSFIEAAKKESIDHILEMGEYKVDHKNSLGVCELLVVAGCLAQRYSVDLENELPEVDLFIGTGEYNKIVRLLEKKDAGLLEEKSFIEVPRFIHDENDERLLSTPSYMAWFKVSEGCDRHCTYCAIPSIRGKLRSRSVESLVIEAKKLAQNGVKELNIISQDLSKFGSDLNEPQALVKLIHELEMISGIEWVRLFYYYPDDLNRELIEKIKTSRKVCYYLDMPIQHFSDSVLKRMNRKITGKEIIEKISFLKSEIPNIVLRTSLIVGFPGETNEDFQVLVDGIKKIEFNHLGVFAYSDEEGTPAFHFKEKISSKVIKNRFNKVYQIQKKIAEQKNKEYLGKIIDVLIEGTHEETELLIVGRHQGQAPEIDGKVIINDAAEFVLNKGQIVKVEITEVQEYDLIGKIIQ